MDNCASLPHSCLLRTQYLGTKHDAKQDSDKDQLLIWLIEYCLLIALC